MLDPDEIQDLGEDSAEEESALVRAVLLIIAADVAYVLRRSDGGIGVAYSRAQHVSERVRAAVQRVQRRISRKVGQEVSDGLDRALAHDIESIGTALGALPADLRRSLERSGSAAVSQVTDLVRRENLNMSVDARQAFLEVSTRHILRVDSGAEGFTEAGLAAARELARRGVRVVDYASGASAAPDVAVRRHVATQVVQTGNSRTLEICGRLGVGLVEVSSHAGARPSHRDWQGRVYALHGPATVDGVTYQDFGEATGYYGSGPHGGLADRLCGINCRHSFAPCKSGQDQRYSPTPDEDRGDDPDEVYEATQTQRRLERGLREARRAAEMERRMGIDSTADEALAKKYDRMLDEHVEAHRRWLRRDARRES